jgi:GDPmannose 4,6-dehydratase
LHENFKIIHGDIVDSKLIANIISDMIPYIYINCAAQSNVTLSFENPEHTMEVTGNSVKYCLDAIKQYSPYTRFVTLSSSEMFNDPIGPWNENSLMVPQSPYAEAKLFAYNLTKQYRADYNLFASNAICFNSESSRRGEAFVTKKIVQTAVKIKFGLENKLYLGNILSARDWSHASDTASAIYKIATANDPDDFVIASGEMHFVKEFVEKVFQLLQLNWEEYVVIDQNLFRPNKENSHPGDISKIKDILNWKSAYSFNGLIDEMVTAELMDK